jgi:ribosomal protein S18 acetylase RimI-like enzyme
MTGLTIRPVRQGDAPALQANCWPEKLEAAVTIFISDVLRRTSHDLAWGMVAVREGGIAVGYGQIARWARVGEISDLIVAEAWRDQGIGTDIIQHLLDIARQKGLRQVEIGAQESNNGALKLYRRLGFVDQRQVTMQLPGGDQSVIMLALDLTSLSKSA